ncbi:MAG: single-stranded DNA-binding protein [Rhodococcus sp.]|nr:single-stranded DNA-binding protein [Rhodococcus sp. (in: high G+C Gram-positive bacteria)]
MTKESDTAVEEGQADVTVGTDGSVTNDSAANEDLVDDLDGDDLLVEEGEIAGDYLEQLLDILDFDGDIDLDVEGDRAVVSIDGGTDLEKLVGRKGEVLDALQELTRLAVQQSTGERSRLMLDISGWRAGIRAELTELGVEAARRVAETGKRESLRPMTPFERKIVHDAVATVSGVSSESEGAEPQRRVVVLKD